MKKLLILSLILLLTGCTSVPTLQEYRRGQVESSYSLPFEICASKDGRYILRKVEYGPGLEVVIDGEKHIFDYWLTPEYAEIFDDGAGNIYVCMGSADRAFTQVHVLSFEEGRYVDNLLDFSGDALKEKIFPHLKVNYDEKAHALGIFTDVPAYEGKNYAQFTLPLGEDPVECYYKVPGGGISATMDENLVFTLTFPLEYKIQGSDGQLISKPTYLYAETKVYYHNRQFVIGYKDADGRTTGGFIHVYKTEAY